MQRGFSCACRISAIFVVGVSLASPHALLSASESQMITISGQKISSVFEGLKPSKFILEYLRLQRDRRRNTERWLLDERKSEANLGARYLTVQCSQCPNTTVCADHYQFLDDSIGCVDTLGVCSLPLKNATTDTTRPHIERVPAIATVGRMVAWMRRNATTPEKT